MTDLPLNDDAGLLAKVGPADNDQPLSVSDLSAALKRAVEDRFGHVRVRGEISGFKRVASGHCYLCLKDEGAVIDGVIWKGTAQGLRFRPEDGIEVIATGRLTTYPGRSKYQIIIDRLELAGAGALMALLEKRRLALAAEGLFDAARKQALPFLPDHIGIVTSPTGAVIRDILHRLADRFPRRVTLWPVKVQGEGAAAEVAAAVAGFNAMTGDDRPDLIIVARGGGSIEDLWPFNEEAVVRAVAASQVPVISAVGHETDTTLCDFAADVRAPTPTAAAEMAVPVRAELLSGVRQLAVRAERGARRGLELKREQAGGLARRLPGPRQLLDLKRQRADDLGDRLPRALGARLTAARAALATAGGAVRPRLLIDRVQLARHQLDGARLRPMLIGRLIDSRKASLDQLWRVAQSLDPRALLGRGYVLVAGVDGRLVTSAAAARAAGRLRLGFADGEVPVRVEGGGAKPPRADDQPAVQPRLI